MQPKRVRHPTDRWFTFRCSPPCLAAAQLLQVSGRRRLPGGDLHPSDSAPRRRTRSPALRAILAPPAPQHHCPPGRLPPSTVPSPNQAHCIGAHGAPYPRTRVTGCCGVVEARPSGRFLLHPPHSATARPGACRHRQSLPRTRRTAPVRTAHPTNPRNRLLWRRVRRAHQWPPGKRKRGARATPCPSTPTECSY